MNNPFNSNTFHINSVYTVSLQGAIAINHQKRERQNPYLEMLGEKREKETHIYTVYIPSCIYKQNKKQARANIVYILMYVHRSNSVCRSTGNGDVLFFFFFLHCLHFVRSTCTSTSIINGPQRDVMWVLLMVISCQFRRHRTSKRQSRLYRHHQYKHVPVTAVFL